MGEEGVGGSESQAVCVVGRGHLGSALVRKPNGGRLDTTGVASTMGKEGQTEVGRAEGSEGSKGVNTRENNCPTGVTGEATRRRRRGGSMATCKNADLSQATMRGSDQSRSGTSHNRNCMPRNLGGASRGQYGQPRGRAPDRKRFQLTRESLVRKVRQGPISVRGRNAA